ncbi:MAG: hypothetical protein ABFE13_13690 [Phycisphaerales bacterium]
MKVRSKYLLIMAAVWVPCLSLAVASYVLVLRPQLDCRHDLEAKVVLAKEYYARALEAAKPELQARLTGQVERLRGRIEDFLVHIEDAPQLAFAIGNMAQETRLESFGIRPVSAKASLTSDDLDRVAERRLNVSFLAGFTRFAAFLNALERYHPVVFVETFTINRPQEADAQPQVDMGLAVLVEKPQGI